MHYEEGKGGDAVQDWLPRKLPMMSERVETLAP
jgi:hypothetical protein